jgi:hypothetical protein
MAVINRLNNLSTFLFYFFLSSIDTKINLLGSFAGENLGTALTALNANFLANKTLNSIAEQRCFCKNRILFTVRYTFSGKARQGKEKWGRERQRERAKDLFRKRNVDDRVIGDLCGCHRNHVMFWFLYCSLLFVRIEGAG